MLPFFCGQGPDCKQPTVDTFLKAKFNLETNYLGLFSDTIQSMLENSHNFLEIIKLLTVSNYTVVCFWSSSVCEGDFTCDDMCMQHADKVLANYVSLRNVRARDKTIFSVQLRMTSFKHFT